MLSATDAASAISRPGAADVTAGPRRARTLGSRAPDRPDHGQPAHPAPPARRRRPATAGILCVVATVAGAGWLYLLRDVSALAFGPHVGGALPLQRLAGGDDQPLARLVTAWVPAGLAAGCALAALTGLRRWARAAVAAVTTWLVLAATGAAADAVTANERLTQHVDRPGRPPGAVGRRGPGHRRSAHGRVPDVIGHPGTATSAGRHASRLGRARGGLT